MRVDIEDARVLSEAKPRSIRTYLRLRGWRPAGEPRESPDIWFIDQGTDTFEVIAPSSQNNRDFARRVADVLEVLSVVEARSQLDVLSDLLTIDFDVHYIKTSHAGPPGTAPIRDAAKIFSGAQMMVAAAAMSLEIPRTVLPARRTQKTSDLLRKVLAGPTAKGSYVVSLWIPVPPRLSPEEDEILFAFEDEPFERNVGLRIQGAAAACHDAAELALETDAGLDAFLSRVDNGVTANICEALVGMSGEERTPLMLSFAWALDRPVRTRSDPVAFESRLMPVLESAAKEIRALTPEEEVTVRGNVVRLHRAAKTGKGEITIAGYVVGDYDDHLGHIVTVLEDVDYQSAIKAHQEFRDVEVTGPLIRKGSRLSLQEVHHFAVRATDSGPDDQPRLLPQ